MIVEHDAGETIAAQLARYAANLTYEDLTKEAIAAAKTLILDQLACELMGSTLPWVAPALQLVQLTEGVKPEATIVNSKFRCLAADAAFVNATYGQACELDDYAYGSSGHIGTATVPVAIALGEREQIDGRRFLTALVAGYEVMFRIMAGVRPYHDVRGFHSQSIGGPFGAAAVAGQLLNLDAAQMTHALAIAGSHACGTLEFDQSGGEVKRVHAGLATRGGIHSALLAKFGLTGPPTIIEGKRGFCNLFATQSTPSKIIEGLGETCAIESSSFKLYPTIGTIHTAINAVDTLVARDNLKAADVARIRVGLTETTLLHGAGIRQPRDVLGAQYSLAFSVALSFIKGNHDLAHYMNPALWSDPEILNIIDRVEAYAHPEAQGKNARMAAVTVEMKNGQTFERTVLHQRGSPPNPASADELSNKVRRLSASALGPQRIDALIAAVDRLEDMDSISSLTANLGRDD